MAGRTPQREDRRRELTLWILVGADMTGVPGPTARAYFERAFVGVVPPPSAREASEWFAVERFEDYLPDPEEWDALLHRIDRVIDDLTSHADEVDAVITAASPRWRIDRMPVIDRTLLRIGVAELLYADKPRPRATINGLIELAKRFGSETTPAFVNGILDQIRRDRDIPFG